GLLPIWDGRPSGMATARLECRRVRVPIEIFPISRRRIVNQERTLVNENLAGNQPAPYIETGGLRWGQSLWSAANATWPFARIYVSADHLRLSVNVGKLWKRSFDFERAEVRQIRRKPGL